MLWPVLCAALAASAPAATPSPQESELAAAARRETQRRSHVPRSQRSYGDEDLRPAGSAAAQPGEQAETPAESTSGGDADGGERGSWAEQGRQAHSRLAAAQQELAQNLGKQEGLRAQINPMSFSFVIDTNQQLQIQSDLTDLQREQAGLQRALDEAQAAWNDLLESARRQGVKARTLEPDSASGQ